MIDFPKVISAQQTRGTDAHTITSEPIASIDLMERASMAFVDEFCKKFDANYRIAVLCGTGNNGGDGFAIARILQHNDYEVIPIFIRFSDRLSADCKINLNRLKHVVEVSKIEELPELSEFDLFIDALLGSGLKRPVKGFLGDVIEALNSSDKPVISVDISSGLYCDQIENNPTAIKADWVISFQRPKLAFFFPEYGDYIKKWSVVDIGLDEEFIQNQETKFRILSPKISSLLRPRNRYSHKGSYGHSLLIAGSLGKIGAAVLAAKACLRSGTGLLTVQVPKCGYEIMQTSVPEAMCLVDVSHNFISECPDPLNYSVVGIGPGLDRHPLTVEAMERLLDSYRKPMVIDADGLNILAQHQNLIEKVPENSILTPHIKEFDRLFGPSKNSLERYQKQLYQSKKNRLIIVLKDAHTAISSPDEEIFFNFTGNPGMATAGSGDVLTGIITGLVAQKYPSLEAALIGTYYHGLAGDSAAKDKGEIGVLASDIINHLKIKHEERT
ncbi:MAG: bifunctional ADP-dependent NAD(P)H-hydrate dehydratase/NAD(P)H-hydrate epimerase [Flavobacteriaceae bacterium]|nr:bifunctional ADP-dependent NAD(P)H-hydrate dehydratase/NAD(P)H-hydrate epimerase [Flavobacteriaceae bacterium]|tara:strand:- start:543312 stop:544808 length:1497 start_codon:yes stop_codon:yes gene_type:complete